MIVVLGAIVVIVVLVLVLDHFGLSDTPTLRKIEWVRSRSTAFWWSLLAAAFLATGIFVLQLAGFLLLFYIALVAIGIYDVDAQAIKSNGRAIWRKIRS